MRVKIPRYYRPDQLEDHDVYMRIQWWSQEQRDALRALHREEERADAEKLRPLDRRIALAKRIARLEQQIKAFNPDQPRVPAGQPDGGQWVGDNDAVSDMAGTHEGGSNGDDDDTPPDAGTVDANAGDDTLPTNYATVTDPTGGAPWSQRIDGFGDNGQLMTQRFDNRDGSTVIAEYNATGKLPYDSQFIVSTPDGGRYTITNTGDTQTIVDDITTKVISVSRMTSDGPVADATPDTPAVTPVSFAIPAGPPPVAIAVGAVTAAVALYNLWQSLPPMTQWFSSPTAKPEAQDIPFITVERTREYDGSGTAVSTSVGAMAESQARQACPAYNQMQRWTNEGYAQAVQTMPGASPQAIGVAAHLYVTNRVRASGNPSLEVAELLPSYGSTRIPGQIMADVNEYVADNTLCIYDFKTGVAGLPRLRADEFARRMVGFLEEKRPPVSRFIVIEMRPR